MYLLELETLTFLRNGKIIDENEYQKIVDNPNWTFAGIYAERGKSGTSTEKRQQFMRMINDALSGNIDLILTKSISRFARNTLDTVKYVRILKEKNIGIYFEEEKINTLDMTGELLLTILSSIAQQEAQNLSNHVSKSAKIRMSKGIYVGTKRLYGLEYDFAENHFNIIEDEAEIVKEIYKMFLSGSNCSEIAKILTERKVKKIKSDNTVRKGNTIHQILKNEKYTGNLILGKTFIPNVLDHKSYKNNGERDRYYIKNAHEAIISMKDFDKVQKIFEKRKLDLQKRIDKDGYITLFRGKIFCDCCGMVRHRGKSKIDDKNDKATYICKKVYAGGHEACPDSVIIKTKELKDSFKNAVFLLNKFLKDNKLLEYEELEKMLSKYEISKTNFNSELFEKLIKKIYVGGLNNNNLKIRFILNDYFYDNQKEKLKEFNMKTNLVYRKYKPIYTRLYINKLIFSFEFEVNRNGNY